MLMLGLGAATARRHRLFGTNDYRKKKWGTFVGAGNLGLPS